MQKYLAIGRGVKILDQKNRGGGVNETSPPASLRVIKIQGRRGGKCLNMRKV